MNNPPTAKSPLRNSTIRRRPVTGDPLRRSAILLGACVLCASSSPAAVVFTEDFGSTQANPTTNPFTVQQTWSYSDSTGTTINSNESRLFNPGGAGSGETTVGWISALTSGNTFQQIQSGGTFSGLPTLNVGESYLLTLTWYAAGQTSTTNDVQAYVNFATVGKDLTFVSGSNGSSAGYTPQTLADSSVATDTVLMNFLAEGGPGGYVAGRSFTASFLTTEDLNGGAFTLALGRGANVGGPTFILYDNVSLDVSVVPEPSVALLGGLGTLCLLRRRRA